jgi:hypothetical protein
MLLRFTQFSVRVRHRETSESDDGISRVKRDVCQRNSMLQRKLAVLTLQRALSLGKGPFEESDQVAGRQENKQ